ncbi:EamA family transporter [Pseudochrobactrum algeriensis]|nr:EamA family transporter [Ochrobactrum sp. MR34]QVQ38437.1 EamA family transporter [Pseudochrobactrum algeriensis]QVQ41654.1 EamA family transporter [Pseudochrobactrum algeriensis]QVQ45581.1 EamA family transporter [Pseudochrobactrum algeriensis]
MLLLALMWGLSIPATKLGLNSTPPLTLTALRYAVAVPFMLLLLIGKKPLPWKAVPTVAMLGIIGIGLGQVAQTIGVNGTSASVGTILSATIPLFIVIFATYRLKQPITIIQICGVATAFIGIVVVAFENTSPDITTTFSGPVWIQISAIAVAFYYVWSVELTLKYGTVVVVTWSTFFGLLAMIPLAAWETYQAPFTLTAISFGAAAYLGLIVSVAGLFLWIGILKNVPAPVAASIQYLQPVFGIIASAILFGDNIGLQFLLGVSLILAGLALTMRNKKAR